MRRIEKGRGDDPCGQQGVSYIGLAPCLPPAAAESASPTDVAMSDHESRKLAALRKRLAQRFPIKKQLDGHRPAFLVEADESLLIVKPVFSPSAAARMASEAMVLAETSGPAGLVPFRTLELDEDFLVVRPWAPGVTLNRLDRRLSPPEAMRLICDVLATLVALHDKGLLHRNLKMSNVLLSDTRSELLLLDAGWDDGQVGVDAGVIEAERVGRLTHLAPEQTGSLDYEIGEWSDLYSVGALLFEALTRQSLFESGDVSHALLRQLTFTVPSLAKLNVSAPVVLDEFLRRLLNKDPRSRYQSSRGAEHDAIAIERALQRPGHSGSMVLGLEDRRATLAEPALVGRERELRVLQDLLDDQDGESTMALVAAESGGGKSRLLAEFCSLAQRHGATVFRAQGVMRESHRPFHMLASLADQATQLASEAEVADALRRELDQDKDVVMEVMPALAEALQWDQRVQQRGEFGEQRSIRAYAALLAALGRLSQKVVVVLDDCQWADELTFECLRSWKRGRLGRLSVVVALRTEETPAERVDSLAADETLRLTPLRPQGVKSLLESMAGPLPAAVVDKVASLSDGSPFVATALLRGLVEADALRPTRDGWEADLHRMATVQPSGDAADLLARRIELLPPETAKLLSRAAILGKRFDLSFAAYLANVTTARSARGAPRGAPSSAGLVVRRSAARDVRA